MFHNLCSYVDLFEGKKFLISEKLYKQIDQSPLRVGLTFPPFPNKALVRRVFHCLLLDKGSQDRDNETR